jgi:hypothetical protein
MASSTSLSMVAPNAKMRVMVVPSDLAGSMKASQPAACEPNCAHHRSIRLSWARLLKRVLLLDLEHCLNCGGELKVIAAILKAPVIERHPHAPRTAGPGTAAATRAWTDVAASGLTASQPIAAQAPRRLGPRDRLRPGLSAAGQSALIVRVHL